MRLRLCFRVSQFSHVPLNYSYYIASAIKRAIERVDSHTSMDLHLSNLPKLFTFGKTMIPEKRIVKDKIPDSCKLGFEVKGFKAKENSFKNTWQ